MTHLNFVVCCYYYSTKTEINHSFSIAINQYFTTPICLDVNFRDCASGAREEPETFMSDIEIAPTNPNPWPYLISVGYRVIKFYTIAKILSKIGAYMEKLNFKNL